VMRRCHQLIRMSQGGILEAFGKCAESEDTENVQQLKQEGFRNSARSA
jgi:hypothetical protein